MCTFGSSDEGMILHPRDDSFKMQGVEVLLLSLLNLFSIELCMDLHIATLLKYFLE